MNHHDINALTDLSHDEQAAVTLTISAADYLRFTRASRQRVDEFPGGAPMGGAHFLDKLVASDPDAFDGVMAREMKEHEHKERLSEQLENLRYLAHLAMEEAELVRKEFVEEIDEEEMSDQTIKAFKRIANNEPSESSDTGKKYALINGEKTEIVFADR